MILVFCKFIQIVLLVSTVTTDLCINQVLCSWYLSETACNQPTVLQFGRFCTSSAYFRTWDLELGIQ